MNLSFNEINLLDKEHCIKVIEDEGLTSLPRSSIEDGILKTINIPLEDCDISELKGYLLYNLCKKDILKKDGIDISKPYEKKIILNQGCIVIANPDAEYNLILLDDSIQLIPHKVDRSKDYKIFTKDDYIKYNLSDKKAKFISKEYIKILNDRWDELSKDFNFIIGVGEENNLMFFSVEYFNNNILS